MTKKRASTLIYLIFLFTVILAFCALAIDATIIYTTRIKLQDATERAALAGAEGFNENFYATPTQAVIEQAVSERANDAFKNFLFGDLKISNTTINRSAKYPDKKILVQTSVSSPTFFLSFLGVESVKLKAKACAISENLNVKSNFDSTMWLNLNALYRSSVVYSLSSVADTAILGPLGRVGGSAYKSASINTEPVFSLIDDSDNHPLSLGPGGFLMLRLPAPIVDKPGPDLFIKEAGDALEGYFVFAGIDVNPSNPYVNSYSTGDGIFWKNITCSGQPEYQDNNNLIGVYSVATLFAGQQDKFYGSGYFDLGHSCVNLSMVKYIKIIDDNSESAFVKRNIGNPAPSSSPPYSYYKTMLYGEASTATAGADIDSVTTLNFVRLISPSDY